MSATPLGGKKLGNERSAATNQTVTTGCTSSSNLNLSPFSLQEAFSCGYGCALSAAVRGGERSGSKNLGGFRRRETSWQKLATPEQILLSILGACAPGVG